MASDECRTFNPPTSPLIGLTGSSFKLDFGDRASWMTARWAIANWTNRWKKTSAAGPVRYPDLMGPLRRRLLEYNEAMGFTVLPEQL